MSAETSTPAVPPIACDRAELLDLIQQAEKRLLGIRNVVGSALFASGQPVVNTFEDKVAGLGGGLLATHYASTVLALARRALTTHPAGSLEPHLLGFAESIARSVLNENREASTP
ncbi:hypothetical protein [Rathayibacter sp. AY1B8]|uniref:hypothetical protein n=1 Tax=Rathayibacter sp. AY1B8 TaxID=2080533 RepID=UPI000CE74ECE|nr:hypothetical protein [Rathayibacter sp. AY1B8]PPI08217.1 hypothetical protein C5C63_04490 [Rathayibacter sp. AY1B8]